MDSIYYFLMNLAPFAPMVLIAGGMTYWLRTSRQAWIATGVVVAIIAAFLLTFRVRDMGFHFYGAACSVGKARGFMEAMQWLFVAEAAGVLAGCLLLVAAAAKRNRIVAAVLGFALLAAALMAAFYMYFASGMTAVDGYGC